MEESLDQAFYGPPILPVTAKDLRSDNHNSSFQNPFFSFLKDCLTSGLFQIIFSILLLIGILFISMWFLFRPNPITLYATSASLTEFNATHDHNLQYILSLNLTIHNPNKRVGIYYDDIDLTAFYKGHQFGSVNVQTFYQGHKNTTFLDGVVMKGQHPLILKDVEELAADKGKGEIYDIDVKVSFKVRYKFWIVKSTKISHKIRCDLSLPFFNTNHKREFIYDVKRGIYKLFSPTAPAFEAESCYLDRQ